MTDQAEVKPSQDALSAFSKALSERNILIDGQDFTIAHVDNSQLFSRTEGQDKTLLAAHDYRLNLLPTWDCVLHLATLVVQKHKRARPDKLNQGNNLQLHLAAEGLEALQLLNGEITLDDGGDATGKPSFDFAAHGLDASYFVTDKAKCIYTMPQNAGTKLYLKAEFKNLFDDLADAGILSEDYGRNKVKEGEFIGNFAVLCIN